MKEYPIFHDVHDWVESLVRVRHQKKGQKVFWGVLTGLVLTATVAGTIMVLCGVPTADLISFVEWFNA